MTNFTTNKYVSLTELYLWDSPLFQHDMDGVTPVDNWLRSRNEILEYLREAGIEPLKFDDIIFYKTQDIINYLDKVYNGQHKTGQSKANDEFKTVPPTLLDIYNNSTQQEPQEELPSDFKALKEQHDAFKKEQPEKKPTVSLGDKFGGGTVFWISEAGNSGLIMANEDQGQETDWFDGMRVAASYRYQEEKNIDWRLPTQDELNKMYEYFKKNNTENNNSYWSSSESTRDNAWCQDFSNGGQDFLDKIYHFLSIRAIRAFTI
jgi:hypothetical protein